MERRLILSFANGKLDFDLISNAWYHLFYSPLL
jgi:hypothetical protein